MGFRKAGATLTVVEQALAVALVERHIAATEATHRHDQAIVSLLAYKHLGEVVAADGDRYLSHLSPTVVPGQKIWVHRRAIRREDVMHLAAHLSRPGEPYVPRPAYSHARAQAMSDLFRTYWYFGRGDRVQAGARLSAAFALIGTNARKWSRIWSDTGLLRCAPGQGRTSG